MDPVYIKAVQAHFELVKAYWERTTPTFIVKTRGKGYRQHLMKPAFKALADELRGHGYLPRIRWIIDNYHISILDRKVGGEESYLRNKLLFAATVLTVMFDGYLRSNNPILTQELMSDVPAIVNAMVFTIALLIIFGVHEYGHRYMAIKRGMDTSQPYFIPAPPGMGGTLGAVLSQREPPVNRDALYDLGLIMGIIPIVAIAGGRWWPYLAVLPVTLLPIAGKTVHQLVHREAAINAVLGWSVYVVVPLLAVTMAAVWFVRQAAAGQSARDFTRRALLLCTWVYFLLNFAFFHFPWPWAEWTGRTPNGVIFTVCAFGLTALALIGGRGEAPACSTPNQPS